MKVYGPYLRKDGTRQTISYPKYLVEEALNRKLTENETVDHIDGNFNNNDLSNLRIINRNEHCFEDHVFRNKETEFTCVYCGKKFKETTVDRFVLVNVLENMEPIYKTIELIKKKKQQINIQKNIIR